MQKSKHFKIIFLMIFLTHCFCGQGLCLNKNNNSSLSYLSPDIVIDAASFQSIYDKIASKNDSYNLHMSQRAADFYSKVAKVGWNDLVPEDRMQQFTLSSMPELISFISQQIKGKKVLSVGSGRAELEQRLAKNNDVTCLDAVEEMVLHAREKGLKAFVSKTEKLNFEDGEFDLVILPFSIPHFKSVNDILQEAKRVLNKNGKILIINPQFVAETGKTKKIKGNGTLKLEQLVEFVTNAGFEVKYSRRRVILPSKFKAKQYNVNYIFASVNNSNGKAVFFDAEYFCGNLIKKNLEQKKINEAI